MQRVSVVGASGVGKTSMARALAEVLDVPHHELDALHWGPDWTASDTFRDDVARIASGDRWVIDGNYSSVRDLVLERVDTVVWLRLPRRIAMARLVRRSVGRVARRHVLWNGNTESLGNLVRVWDREHLLRWSWNSHARHRARYGAEMGDPALGHVRYVVLERPEEVEHFLAEVGRRSAI